MRNYYNKGGPTLTKGQKTLPKELQKKATNWPCKKGIFTISSTEFPRTY